MVKTSNETYINIVLAPDDNYAMPCAVTMRSILDNSNSDFRFHILSADISDKNKNKLKKLLNKTNSKIYFYDMNKYDFSDFPLNRKWISIAAYYRLKILDVLPLEIKRIIYLDCDTIVCKDISELYYTKLDNAFVGVVEDDRSLVHPITLGLPIENNYFNSGVILFDLEKLRTFDFEKKTIDYFKQNQEIIKFQDQDILNGVLNGHCKYLSLCWNVNTEIAYLNNKNNNYTIEQMKDALLHPGIIHFTGSAKPWILNNKHPLKHIWWHYFNECNYKMYYLKYLLSIFTLKNVFSIRNEYHKGNKHKVITILGMKIKLKCKPKSETLVPVERERERERERESNPPNGV